MRKNRKLQLIAQTGLRVKSGARRRNDIYMVKGEKFHFDDFGVDTGSWEDQDFLEIKPKGSGLRIG